MVKWVNSQKGPGESDGEKMLQKMTTEAMEEMSLLFRNVHALACYVRPFKTIHGCVHLTRQRVYVLEQYTRTTKKQLHFAITLQKQKELSHVKRLKVLTLFH